MNDWNEPRLVLAVQRASRLTGAAKALGRKVRGFDGAVWLDHRFSIVVRANEEKFKQNAPGLISLAFTNGKSREGTPVMTMSLWQVSSRLKKRVPSGVILRA